MEPEFPLELKPALLDVIRVDPDSDVNVALVPSSTLVPKSTVAPVFTVKGMLPEMVPPDLLNC